MGGMSSPYRESASSAIQCPRCGIETAGGDLVACVDSCGVWVTTEATQTAFEASELKPSRVASWFRTLCACPVCSKPMTLRGHDMSLFQGCDAHGFWVDESTVTQTGLGRVSMSARLGQARAHAKLAKDAQVQAAREEQARIAMLEHQARERGTTAAAEAARQRELEAKAAREAAEERARALREKKRQRLAATVRAAIADDDVMPIVDELMRLDDAITTLANRMTDRGI